MLSCKQASQLISQSLDRQLSRRERFALRMHLWICKYCRRFSQQIKIIRVAITQHVNDIEHDSQIRLSDVAKRNITNLINNQH
jgi:Putative zinc-finger